MSDTALQTPRKTRYLLVMFRYAGVSGEVRERYTNYDADAEANDGDGVETFTSMATMEVRLPKMSGSISHEALMLNLPRNTFLDRISDGYPHAPIFIKVWEFVTSDLAPGEDVQVTHYRGRVASTLRNPDNREDRVQVDCYCIKTQLNIALGLPANHTCDWTFGDRSAETATAGLNCKIDVTSLLQTGTITVISGKQVTVTGLTAPGGAPGVRYWHRGWLKRGGLRIQIREWTAGTTFQLVKEPPPDWVGTTVTACPGCDKTKATCATRWSNIANFMGFGDAIPSRNPTNEYA